MSDQPDLKTKSESFADMVQIFADAISSESLSQGLSLGMKQAFGSAEIPKDVEGKLVESLMAVGKCFYLGPAEKLKGALGQVSSSLAQHGLATLGYFALEPFGRAASRLMTVSEIMGVTPMQSNARLVHSSIDYASTKANFSWSGTVVEARMKGEKPFVVFVPGERCSFSNNGRLEVRARTVRAAPGPNRRY